MEICLLIGEHPLPTKAGIGWQSFIYFCLRKLIRIQIEINRFHASVKQKTFLKTNNDLAPELPSTAGVVWLFVIMLSIFCFVHFQLIQFGILFYLYEYLSLFQQYICAYMELRYSQL